MRAGVTAQRSILDIDVRAVFQPIVDLWTRDVVGYEALARGPIGDPLESPAALFDAARACGELAEFDWVCRAAAVRAALDGRLAAPLRLFVNAEPAAMNRPCPELFVSLMHTAQRRFRPVLE